MMAREVDLAAITNVDAADSSGIAHAAELIAFTDALVKGGDDELAQARAHLLAAVGSEGLVDTAGIVANFQRMVRIADATGIPLDTALDVASQDVRDELALERFGSSRNTAAASLLRRATGRVLRPLLHSLLRALGRRHRRA